MRRFAHRRRMWKSRGLFGKDGLLTSWGSTERRCVRRRLLVQPSTAKSRKYANHHSFFRTLLTTLILGPSVVTGNGRICPPPGASLGFNRAKFLHFPRAAKFRMICVLLFLVFRGSVRATGRIGVVQNSCLLLRRVSSRRRPKYIAGWLDIPPNWWCNLLCATVQLWCF